MFKLLSLKICMLICLCYTRGMRMYALGWQWKGRYVMETFFTMLLSSSLLWLIIIDRNGKFSLKKQHCCMFSFVLNRIFTMKIQKFKCKSLKLRDFIWVNVLPELSVLCISVWVRTLSDGKVPALQKHCSAKQLWKKSMEIRAQAPALTLIIYWNYHQASCTNQCTSISILRSRWDSSPETHAC